MQKHIKLLQQKTNSPIYQESKCLIFGFADKTFSLIINRGNFDLYIEIDKINRFSSSKFLNRFKSIGDAIQYIENSNIEEKSFPLPNEKDTWMNGKKLCL